ncbi:MAG TPA: hypothetical protein VHJ18_07655 [Streptosporangiaceae bacterium]|nr:hypothetical protein [Streptosporangiaceae bacterium]
MRTAHTFTRPERQKTAPKRKMSVSMVAAAAGLIVIATATMAACGQVSTSGASGPGSRQTQSGQRGGGNAGSGGHARMIRLLCAQPRAATVVRVVRFGSRAQLGQTKPLRRPIPGITIKDKARVRELAVAICKLPRMPRGIIHCPADLGGGYVLQFSAPGARLHAITLRTSGCEAVSGTGHGRARWVARKPLFWQQLAHVTGITAPAHAQS